ncbi:MAG: hypothetical protein AABX27_03840 [Nanoarchaeota archaeon]
MKKRKYIFDNPVVDGHFRALWKALEKNHPYKGMTTQQVLDKLRED